MGMQSDCFLKQKWRTELLMRFYTDIFSPSTYEAFCESDRHVAGFKTTLARRAKCIEKGDRFVCYVTRLSRWVGVLEVVRGPYFDYKPLFQPVADPFTLRF